MRKLVIATALAVGSAGLASMTTAPAHAGVPWLVTIKPGATQITLGQTVTFTGQVTPKGAATGLKVTLQEQNAPGKPWQVKDTDKINAKGRYQVSEKPTVNTARKYRVVMAATTGHAKGVSSAVSVKVYGWSKLTDHPYVNGEGMYPRTSVDLNGVKYNKSISASWGGATSLEFNVDHKCIALKGAFGIDDNSETGAQATVTAVSDGTQVYTHTFSVGQVTSKRITLDSPLKLKFSAESVVDGVSGYGAIGTPQILCTR